MKSTNEPPPETPATERPTGLRPLNEFLMMLPAPLRAELEAAPAPPRLETPLNPRDRLSRAVASVPKEHAWASMMEPAFQALVPKASQVAQHALEPGHLTILGPQRSGKSTLAAVLFDAWVKNALRADAAQRERALVRRAEGRWWSALRLCSLHFAHGHGGGPCDAVEQARLAPLLVIDGLGRERESAWILHDVLFDRWDEMRPTWVTTGLTGREIVARYGGDLASRLLDRAETFVTSEAWGRLHAAPFGLLSGGR